MTMSTAPTSPRAWWASSSSALGLVVTVSSGTRARAAAAGRSRASPLLRCAGRSASRMRRWRSGRSAGGRPLQVLRLRHDPDCADDRGAQCSLKWNRICVDARGFTCSFVVCQQLTSQRSPRARGGSPKAGQEVAREDLVSPRTRGSPHGAPTRAEARPVFPRTRGFAPTIRRDRAVGGRPPFGPPRGPGPENPVR